MTLLEGGIAALARMHCDGMILTGWGNTPTKLKKDVHRNSVASAPQLGWQGTNT
jgi:hypothetical protein